MRGGFDILRPHQAFTDQIAGNAARSEGGQMFRLGQTELLPQVGEVLVAWRRILGRFADVQPRLPYTDGKGGAELLCRKVRRVVLR